MHVQESLIRSLFPVCIMLVSITSLRAHSVPQAAGISAIPFQLIHDLIFVEATVNGVSGKFMVDTGSEFLVLNHRYFSGRRTEGEYGRSMSGERHDIRTTHANGSLNDVQFKTIAQVYDLSRMERLLRTPIHGLIGYDVLSDYEVVFDYRQKLLFLICLDKNGDRISPFLSDVEPSVVKLTDNEHMPYFTIDLGARKGRFAIDTGANVNQISSRHFKKTASHFTKTTSSFVVGFDGRKSQTLSTSSKPWRWRGVEWQEMKHVVQSMTVLNNTLDMPLHGLLGYEFLHQQTMSINYRKGTLSIWKGHVIESNEEWLAQTYLSAGN